jgi:hypothetical protein
MTTSLTCPRHKYACVMSSSSRLDRRADLTGRPSCDVHPTISMTVFNSPLIWSRVLTLATAARYSLFEPNRLSSFVMKDTFPSSRLQVLSAGKFMRRLFPVGVRLIHPNNVASPQNISSSKEQTKRSHVNILCCPSSNPV